jgi:hypothetical protein
MGLQELIREVKRRAVSDEPLDRLAAAAEHQQEMTDQLDDLLDHFVREARDAGCSWTDIGDVLGVSKQAAQQRHRGPGRDRRRRGRGRFARFTPAARNAVIEAQTAARALDHPAIGTEHVLLGLLDTDRSLATGVLAPWDIDRDEIEAAVASRSETDSETGPGTRGRRGRGGRRGHIPFTRTAKQALEVALREAEALGHDDIGTEHLLLGVLRTDEGLGSRLLIERGIEYRAVRDAVATAATGE